LEGSKNGFLNTGTETIDERNLHLFLKKDKTPAIMQKNTNDTISKLPAVNTRYSMILDDGEIIKFLA
jgi:hypothetical protein